MLKHFRFPDNNILDIYLRNHSIVKFKKNIKSKLSNKNSIDILLPHCLIMGCVLKFSDSSNIDLFCHIFGAFCWYLRYYFAFLLDLESRALHMLDKHCTTEIQPQPKEVSTDCSSKTIHSPLLFHPLILKFWV